MGVTSAISVIFIPAARRALRAASRPDPGPLTYTSTSLMPASIAFLATISAAVVAANGVDLLVPLKPAAPAEPQAATPPAISVTVTRVLLNVEVIYTLPFAIDYFFLTSATSCFCVFSTLDASTLANTSFLRAPIVTFLPLLVLAFVLVLCPLVGSPLTCREPRYDPISFSLDTF